MGTQTNPGKQIFHFFRRGLAKNWLKLMPATQIGITGSFGKTNTTRAIAQVLSSSFQVIQTDLNLDTIYNLPITGLKVRPWSQVAVFELGIDQREEMDRHLEIVRPKIGVVTGITPVHSDEEHLGSLQNIIKEKQKLIAALPQDGLAVLNGDDENVRPMAKFTKAKVLFYGTDKKNCQIWAEKIKPGLKGLAFTLWAGRESYKVKTPLLGRHQIYTCMAATAVGREMGLPMAAIISALSGLSNLKGRLSLEKGPLGVMLLDDHLRANPESTKAGLIFLKDLKTSGRKIAVLGEMGELGEWAVEKHKEIGRLAAGCGLDFLVCVGPLQKYAVESAVESGMDKDKTIWFADVFSASEKLKTILQKGDLFYLKGSLLQHVERILLLLENKPVGCRVVSCHFYHQCPVCPFLQTGPQ